MDLESEELRKNGRQLKLARQPFHMLAVIALGNGRVVTYAELQSKFWPQITIEDYKHSLSNSLLAIRKTLRDSAHSPIYIQTVPTGFRFLIPVTIIEAFIQPNGFKDHYSDYFLLGMKQIREEFWNTSRCLGLARLVLRCEILEKQYQQHPKMHELQLLMLDIRLALRHSAVFEPNWEEHNISFEVAAKVFKDPNAINISLSDSNWETLGRASESVLLVVQHTGYQENGQIRIKAVRRATSGERRLYEQSRR